MVVLFPYRAVAEYINNIAISTAMSKIFFLFIFHLLSRLPPFLDGGSFLEVGVGLAPCDVNCTDITWG